MAQIVKTMPAMLGDLSSIPVSGRPHGKGNGNPLQYSRLKNSIDREDWQGYSPWGCKELDAKERLTISLSCMYICVYIYECI